MNRNQMEKHNTNTKAIKKRFGIITFTLQKKGHQLLQIKVLSLHLMTIKCEKLCWKNKKLGFKIEFFTGISSIDKAYGSNMCPHKEAKNHEQRINYICN